MYMYKFIIRKLHLFKLTYIIVHLTIHIYLNTDNVTEYKYLVTFILSSP